MRSELIIITDCVSVAVAGPSVPTRVRTQIVGNIFFYSVLVFRTVSELSVWQCARVSVGVFFYFDLVQ